MSSESAAPPVVVGIDVAQAELVVALRPSGQWWSVPNTDDGCAALVDTLGPLVPERIVLEATGGLERPLATALTAAGLPVAVVNPRQVRDFARATGRLAKTDALDAHVLAHFAEAVAPAVRPPLDAATQALQALVDRRRQLRDVLVAERQRLRQADPVVRPGITRHVEWLEAELAAIEKELAERVAQDPVWHGKAQRLRTVPAIGPTIAATLLARLPGWADWAAKRSPRCWAWRRIAATVGPCVAGAASGAGGPMSGPRCIWAPWSACGTTPRCARSISGCVLPGNRRRWRSPPAWASCCASSITSLPLIRIGMLPSYPQLDTPRPLLRTGPATHQVVHASWYCTVGDSRPTGQLQVRRY